jgi:hypothetical protein
MTQTIEAIPTWSALLPVLIQAADSDRFETRQAAFDQLERMAELADAYLAIVKASREGKINV